MSNIAILDYGIGNVRSISNAIEKIGAVPNITRNEKVILDSDALILPGVGAFAQGMNNLYSYQLTNLIYKFVDSGKPFLGICLGMQLLLESSNEFGETKGLGLIKGNVNKLPAKNAKLPHVAWSAIKPPQPARWNGTILENAKAEANFYFVHTFVAEPLNKTNVLSLTQFEGQDFCSSVHCENVYGVQFHPEKSGENGLKIFKDFLKL